MCSALSKATVNVLDEPRPELGGTSATLVSSMPLRDAAEAQRLAKDPVLDLVDGVDRLGLRIGEADAVVEAPVRADVDVLVDRGGDQEAAVNRRVARQVGAAAAQREAHRRAGNDHLDGSVADAVGTRITRIAAILLRKLDPERTRLSRS